MIAMALIMRPALLVADEPTTALDVTTQAQILALLGRLQAETGMSILLITHDLGVVANMAHDVAVLYRGRLVEAGSREDGAAPPRPPLPAGPDQGGAPLRHGARRAPDADPPARVTIPQRAPPALRAGPILSVEGVSKVFALRSAKAAGRPADPGGLGRLPRREGGRDPRPRRKIGLGQDHPVEDRDAGVVPNAGRVMFDAGTGPRDVQALSGADLFAYRRAVQFVFQDPYSSLDPRHDGRRDPGRADENPRDPEARAAALPRPDGDGGPRAGGLSRYPHAFSGGQRQRIGIARALALEPRMLLLDEPVSALDVSVQAQILNLLKDLQAALGLTYLIVSHNLAVIDYMADTISVMCRGRIVGRPPRGHLFRNPAHPYTRALLAAVPDPSLDHPLDFAAVSGEHSDRRPGPSPSSRRRGGRSDARDRGGPSGPDGRGGGVASGVMAGPLPFCSSACAAGCSRPSSTGSATTWCRPIPTGAPAPVAARGDTLIDGAARSLEHDLAAAGIAAAGDVAGLVRDFWELIPAAPVRQRRGGSGFNGALQLYVIMRALRPRAIIESGVFRGLTTWVMRRACPEAQIRCFDPDLSGLQYRDGAARYSSRDWSEADCPISTRPPPWRSSTTTWRRGAASSRRGHAASAACCSTTTRPATGSTPMAARPIRPSR